MEFINDKGSFKYFNQKVHQDYDTLVNQMPANCEGGKSCKKIIDSGKWNARHAV